MELKDLMTGTSNGFVLQARDKHLLQELTLMRVIDRDLAKRVAPFGSTTRANSRLLALTRAGFLQRFFMGTIAGGMKAIYGLTLRGARAVGLPYRPLRRPPGEALIADFFVAHQLAVNEIYCEMKYGLIPVAEARFHRWLSFNEPIEPKAPLIPDAYLEVLTPTRVLAAFLEIDMGNEGRRVWKSKVDRYLRYAASGAFERQFGHPQFRVLVVTNSEARMRMIRSVIAQVTQKIFWISSLELLRADGLWSSSWFRPKDEEKQTLL
jgi:hypothetical protein